MHPKQTYEALEEVKEYLAKNVDPRNMKFSEDDEFKVSEIDEKDEEDIQSSENEDLTLSSNDEQNRKLIKKMKPTG